MPDSVTASNNNCTRISVLQASGALTISLIVHACSILKLHFETGRLRRLPPDSHLCYFPLKSQLLSPIANTLIRLEQVATRMHSMKACSV